MHVWSKPRRAQALLASIALLAAAVPLASGAGPAHAAVGTGNANRFLIVNNPTVNVSAINGANITVSGCGFVSGGSVSVGTVPAGSALISPQNVTSLTADPSGCINGTYNVAVGTQGGSYFVEAFDNQQTLYGALAVNNPNSSYGTASTYLNLSANGGTYSGSSIVLPLSGSGTTLSINNASGFPVSASTNFTEYLVSTSNPNTSATVEAVQTGTYVTDGFGTVQGPIPFNIQPSVGPGTYFVILTNGTTYDLGEVQIAGTGTGGGTNGALAFSPNPGVTGQTETLTACGFTSGAAASLSNPSLAVTAYNVGSGVSSNLTSITSVSQTPSQAGTGCYNYSFSAPAAGTYLFTISNGALTDTGYLTVNAPATPTPSPTPSPTPVGQNTNLTFSPISALPGTQVTASGCNFSATDALASNFTLNVGGVLVKPTSISQPLGFGSTCYSFVFTVPQITPSTYSVSAAGPNSTATDFGSFTVLGSTCYNGCNTGCNSGNCYPNCNYGCNTGCNSGSCYPGCFYCGGYIPGNNGGLIIGTSASLTASPSSVVAGGSATLTGSGFYPGASVTLSAPGLGLSTTTLDPYGSFTYTVTPAQHHGEWYLYDHRERFYRPHGYHYAGGKWHSQRQPGG